MNIDNDIFLKHIQQQIHDTSYKDINVADSVMARIESLPPKRRSRRPLAWTISAAASLIIGVSANFAILHSQKNAEHDAMCDLLAELYDCNYSYDNYYSATDNSYMIYDI